MTQIQELSAQPREKTGKGPAYQTRLKGQIPAIIYGGAGEPENVSVDSRLLSPLTTIVSVIVVWPGAKVIVPVLDV